MSKKKAKAKPKVKAKKPERKRQTKEELIKLAEDIMNNLVFTTNHLGNDQNMVTMVFPILALMDSKTLNQLKKDDITLVYEYMDKAAPRAVNGYPMFFSCHCLSREEATEMWGYYNKMRDAKEAAKQSL